MYSIQAEIVNGNKKGDIVLIPRVSLLPTDLRHPFELKRTQFPVKLAYCITINKSEGQSLKKVGLYLEEPVFSHGQLNDALSRVSYPDSILIFTQNNINSTVNIVYKEFFNN